MLLFAQEGLGVDLLSPLGIFIVIFGIIFTIGLPVYMIKFGKEWTEKSSKGLEAVLMVSKVNCKRDIYFIYISSDSKKCSHFKKKVKTSSLGFCSIPWNESNRLIKKVAPNYTNTSYRKKKQPHPK